jgi:hypothetical protein
MSLIIGTPEVPVFEWSGIARSDTINPTGEISVYQNRVGGLRSVVRRPRNGKIYQVLYVLTYLTPADCTALDSINTVNPLYYDGVLIMSDAFIVNPLQFVEQKHGYYTTSLIMQGKRV